MPVTTGLLYPVPKTFGGSTTGLTYPYTAAALPPPDPDLDQRQCDQDRAEHHRHRGRHAEAMIGTPPCRSAGSAPRSDSPGPPLVSTWTVPKIWSAPSSVRMLMIVVIGISCGQVM